MPTQVEFNDVFAARIYQSDEMCAIIETEGDTPETFSSKDWTFTIIAQRKAVPGWYMEKWDLDNPVCNNVGTQSTLIYYTQDEIDDGEVPDEDFIRVKVVPYDEA